MEMCAAAQFNVLHNLYHRLMMGDGMIHGVVDERRRLKLTHRRLCDELTIFNCCLSGSQRALNGVRHIRKFVTLTDG